MTLRKWRWLSIVAALMAGLLAGFLVLVYSAVSNSADSIALGLWTALIVALITYAAMHPDYLATGLSRRLAWKWRSLSIVAALMAGLLAGFFVLVYISFSIGRVDGGLVLLTAAIAASITYAAMLVRRGYGFCGAWDEPNGASMSQWKTAAFIIIVLLIVVGAAVVVLAWFEFLSFLSQHML